MRRKVFLQSTALKKLPRSNKVQIYQLLFIFLLSKRIERYSAISKNEKFTEIKEKRTNLRKNFLFNKNLKKTNFKVFDFLQTPAVL